ncbi:MAG: PAS domain-containing protein [Cyanobacteria bacterium REEB67]|nr:PAS domain-containing protein [Cyanobacteria bacterium REEB67]
MGEARQRSGFSLNLSLNQQGILLVSSLLIVEMIFVASLWSLLMQAETEARREEHAKEIGRRTNALIKSLFEVGTTSENFIASKNANDHNQYLAARREADDSLNWLTNALREDPGQKDRLGRIEGSIREALALYAELDRETRALPAEQAQEMLRERKLDFQMKFNALAADMVKLINAERKIQDTSPETQRAYREQSRTILKVGLAVNIAMALLLALFFTRNIAARLRVILQNTDRLSRRQLLNARLNGNDELTRLDAAFHQMSSQLIQDEARLQASEDRLRAILQQMPVGLLVLTADHTIQFANQAMINMYTGGAEQSAIQPLMGRQVKSLFKQWPDFNSNNSGKSPAENNSAFSRARICELDLVKANGQTLPVEFSMTGFALEGKEKNALTLAIALDVSERRAVQKIRQAFVATVSHELATPLTSIGGFISLLMAGQYGPVSKQAQAEAERAERNAKRLIKLIRDLLDVEKMEGGVISISKVPCLLSQILQDALAAVAVLSAAQQVAIESDCQEIELFVDPDRIVQVVVNLLSNAIKFSEAGAKVTISVIRHLPTVEVRITDSGRGIPIDYQAAIFERFQQVESDDAKKRGGTGLGLSIARAIVERHGGTIGLVSEVGRGSTFWFTLPAEEDDS